MAQAFTLIYLPLSDEKSTSKAMGKYIYIENPVCVVIMEVWQHKAFRNTVEDRVKQQSSNRVIHTAYDSGPWSK